jgi:hypothetical protein
VEFIIVKAILTVMPSKSQGPPTKVTEGSRAGRNDHRIDITIATDLQNPSRLDSFRGISLSGSLATVDSELVRVRME